jgi:hypothetical protein
MGGVCGEESAQGFGGKSRSKEATRKTEVLMGGYQNGSWGIVVDSVVSGWGPVGGALVNTVMDKDYLLWN